MINFLSTPAEPLVADLTITRGRVHERAPIRHEARRASQLSVVEFLRAALDEEYERHAVIHAIGIDNRSKALRTVQAHRERGRTRHGVRDLFGRERLDGLRG